jgi:hypothetical protein
MQCSNNLKQIGLATIQFHETYGKLPPARYYGPAGAGGASPTWAAVITPFIEAQAAHDLWHFDKQYYDALNAPARQVNVPVWSCPTRRASGSRSAERPGKEAAWGAAGDYAGNYGEDIDYNKAGTMAAGVILQSYGKSTNGQLVSWDSCMTFDMIKDG